jgi:hypothetical protein
VEEGVPALLADMQSALYAYDIIYLRSLTIFSPTGFRSWLSRHMKILTTNPNQCTDRDALPTLRVQKLVD